MFFGYNGVPVLLGTLAKWVGSLQTLEVCLEELNQGVGISRRAGRPAILFPPISIVAPRTDNPSSGAR